MLVLPNSFYIVNAILINIPANYFVDIDKLILMFVRRGKISRITNQLNIEEKEQR
jgi:hypothetical protein